MVYAVVMCLSVCLSVTGHYCIKMATFRIRHTTSRDSKSSDAKDLDEIQKGLKMVQDRYIVSVKVQKEIVCMLLNGYVADDFG